MARRSSKGRISILRVGTIAAILGVVVVVAGAVSFFAEQSSHQVPLDIPAFPGALPAGQRNVANTMRRQYYRIPGVTPDQVAAYYNEQLRQYYPPEDQQDCVRTPEVGEFPAGDNTVPFQYICMFDRSGFRASQYTKVTIQPGVFNEDPNLNTQGMTIVEYEQYWQPS